MARFQNYSVANSGQDFRNHTARVQKGNYQQYTPAKKLNECRMGMTKTDKPVRCITGWNYSKGKGLISFVATPSKKYPGKKKSKNGNEFTIFAVKLTFKRTLDEKVFFALFNENSGKLIMDKIGMVADTRQRYFVTIKRR